MVHPTTQRRVIFAVAASFIMSLVALGVVVSDMSRRDSDEDTASLTADDVDRLVSAQVKIAVRDAEARITLLEARLDAPPVTALLPSSDMVEQLGALMSDLDRRIAEIERSVGTGGPFGGGVSSDIERLRSCVNDYMEVIGRWSSNVNSYFSWNYCT